MYVYFTGGGLSPGILVYTFTTAVCSMNTRVKQGLFAATYIPIAFGTMNAALYFGLVEPRNIIGPLRPLSLAESVGGLPEAADSKMILRWLSWWWSEPPQTTG